MTLKSIVFAAGLILGLQAPVQQPELPAPHEAYPGQSQHAVPPAGWMCQPQNYELSVPEDHACSCERMYDQETGQIREDKKCNVWCHPESCLCKVGNLPGAHPDHFDPLLPPEPQR